MCDTDEYVSHILISTNTIILLADLGKYESVCQQKHQWHELHKICNKNKSSSSFLRSGGSLPSDAIRYMVCLVDNADKC